MHSRPLRVLAAAALVGLLAACSLPRGAAMQAEILRGAKSDTADFAVYPVTRDFLPVLAAWPSHNGLRNDWPGRGSGSDDRIIAPGDRLALRIWDTEENSLLTSGEQKAATIEGLVVGPGGTVFIPYLDTVQVAGKTPEAARRQIQRQMEAVLPSAQVQLDLEAGRRNGVDLVGGVGKPGAYDLADRNVSILNVISMAGGVRADLRNPRVRLYRGSRIYETSVERLYASPAMDTRMRGGDKVLITEDTRYFLALGATSSQKQIHFDQDRINALDALSMIGGISAARADPKGILVLREYPAAETGPKGPSKSRVVFSLDLTSTDGLFSARNFPIQPGDVVLATESPVTSARTIIGLIGQGFGLARQVELAN